MKILYNVINIRIFPGPHPRAGRKEDPMANKKTEKKWMRRRHAVVRDLAALILIPITRLLYHVKVERFKDQGDRPYLILLNHQTTFDPFFVGMTFRGPIYYMATEDIFSLGFLSKLLRWAIAPIPIKKQTTDISAVMTCIRLAREGGTIALAPEGNRTYHGRTVYMNPAIAKMARKMKLPIALFRIEDGYGIQPRWADGTRKGTMTARVSRVIELEEYSAMTDEALMELIRNELHVDEAKVTGEFDCKARAQFLERAVYTCPHCGFSKFESQGHEIRCLTCGRKAVYNKDKTMEGDFPFRFVADWYDWQEEFVNKYDPMAHVEEPIFRDTAEVRKVILYSHKELIRKRMPLELYGDRIVMGDTTLHFDDVTAATCLGRNKLNIYHGEDVFQFKGDERFNALKYMNLYFRYRNITRGENDTFLGM